MEMNSASKNHQEESPNQTTAVPKQAETSKTKDKPLILFWTKYHGHYDYWYNRYFAIRDPAFGPWGCRPWECKMTHDRRLLKQSDVVIFSLEDVNPKDLPGYRSVHQIWVAFTKEPPHKIINHGPDLRHFDGFYNLTVTYRSDSDVPLVYGHFYDLDNSTEADSTSLKYPWLAKDEDMLVKEANASDWNYTKAEIDLPSRRKAALMMVSNCENKPRLEYARKLSKYYKVDIKGRCGSGKISRSEYNNPYSEPNYRYYLAFENSNCKDYATEKYFKCLMHDIIPIVMGGADYSKLGPPHSHIDTKDFSDPKSLADYLTYLDGNSSAYLEYFTWKKRYIPTGINNNKYFPCRFCEAIKSRMTNLHYRRTYNIKKWFIQESECKDLNSLTHKRSKYKKQGIIAVA